MSANKIGPFAALPPDTHDVILRSSEVRGELLK